MKLFSRVLGFHNSFKGDVFVLYKGIKFRILKFRDSVVPEIIPK